jgi:hypothetical protein
VTAQATRVSGFDGEPASAFPDGSAGILARQLLHAVAEAPPAELPALVGALAQAHAVALARLTMPRPENREPQPREGNISAEEAARRLGVSPSYIYKNARTLPFTARIGRRVVCNIRGVDRWSRQRQAAGKQPLD